MRFDTEQGSQLAEVYWFHDRHFPVIRNVRLGEELAAALGAVRAGEMRVGDYYLEENRITRLDG